MAMFDNKLLNIPVDKRTHQILRVLAAGRGLKLREILEEFAKPYEYLLAPFEKPNGHKSVLPSHDQDGK
jgi:hypothetical protein